MTSDKNKKTIQMKRAGGLQVPQIIVTQDREIQPHIPSIKISIDAPSSDESEEEEETGRPRRYLRPNNLRCCRVVRRDKNIKHLVVVTNRLKYFSVYEASLIL